MSKRIYLRTSITENSKTISSREHEVLHLLSFGMLTKEISGLLHISHHTVNSHIKNLKTKLQARNSAELVRRGFELELLHHSNHTLSL